MFSEPVRRVVLAEPLALLWSDYGLIQDLQNVVFDFCPVELSNPPSEFSDKLVAPVDLNDPIEEISLNYAVNLRSLKL